MVPHVTVDALALNTGQFASALPPTSYTNYRHSFVIDTLLVLGSTSHTLCQLGALPARPKGSLPQPLPSLPKPESIARY